nr:hypothetical protein B0A51_02028 [Rachicladosporium sp. CCFEE 5018]
MATATLGHLSEDVDEDADNAMIEQRAVSNANGVTCKFHYTNISPKQLDALKPEAWAFTKETRSRTRTRQRGLASTETRQYETHGVGVHTEDALENLDYEVDQPLRRSGRTHKVISGTYVEQFHRDPDAWLLREGRRASRRDLERKGGSVEADISRVTDAEGMADAMNVAEGGVVATPARKVDAADTTAAEFTPTGQKRKRSISAPAKGKDVAAKPEDVEEKPKLKSPSPELEKPGPRACHSRSSTLRQPVPHRQP